ncbi:MAG: AAA family ATPase [Candidatus Levyibacteriota bacterium]
MTKKNNNWYVVTGAPSSGKTTTLQALEEKGYKVYEEWARVYIDSEIKKGKTLKEIRKDEIQFQNKILRLKIDFEKTLNPDSTLFLDRGIPDSIAYMELCNVSPDPMLNKAAKKCCYKKVFLMELLEYEADYARTESQEEAMVLDGLLEQAYKNLGMEVIRVPKMPVKDRMRFIIKNL